jgi:hypothetical protein
MMSLLSFYGTKICRHDEVFGHSPSEGNALCGMQSGVLIDNTDLTANKGQKLEICFFCFTSLEGERMRTRV